MLLKIKKKCSFCGLNLTRFILFTASENTPLASDLDEADNASGTTSSSEAKSEKTENPNDTPTLSRENSKPEPAKPGWFGKGKRKRKMLKT